jgi:hypothetical protein
MALRMYDELDTFLSIELLRLSPSIRLITTLLILLIIPCVQLHVALVNRLRGNPVMTFLLSPAGRVFLVELLLRPPTISINRCVVGCIVVAVSTLE